MYHRFMKIEPNIGKVLFTTLTEVPGPRRYVKLILPRENRKNRNLDESIRVGGYLRT